MDNQQLIKVQFNNFDVSDSITEEAKGLAEVELITNPMATVDDRLMEIEAELADGLIELNNLTNQATKIDYTMAVASGVIAGLIDVIFVGKFDLQAGHEWSTEKINSFVEHVAKKYGYTGDDTKGAIRFLEKYGAPSDSVTAQFGGALQHHLRDFAHHASPMGLVFSILTQFTYKAYGTETDGSFKVVPIENTTFIGEDVPQKISLGLIYWMLHLASDMAGSSGSRGIGTGIPGPILSLVKMLSTLPIFKDREGVNELSIKVSKLFNGTLLAERDADGAIISTNPMDLRGELGVVHQIGKQAVPVVVNEAFVRGFYFVSRFLEEVKGKKSLRDIDWGTTIPLKNATITRMLTISSGTFVAIDTVGAIIEGARNSNADWVEFGRQAFIRLNFVGIGRFTISFGAEVAMCYRRGKKAKEQMRLQNECLYIMGAKLYYGEKLVWTAAKDADESIAMFYNAIDEAMSMMLQDMWIAREKLCAIKKLDFVSLNAKNMGLTDELYDALN